MVLKQLIFEKFDDYQIRHSSTNNAKALDLQ